MMRQRIMLLVSLWATLVAGLVPAYADNLSIGINIGTPPPPPPIVVVAPPPLVVVPGTPVSYAPSVAANYFFYAGRYYTFHNGAWFHATRYNGPWTFIVLERMPPPILAVPVAYYKVPPGHWKKGGPPPWAGHKKGPK
jgi:hypothetical protein